jgi:hypothetical protein
MTESSVPGRGRGGEQPLRAGIGCTGTGLASTVVAGTGTAGTGYAGTMFESTAVAGDWPAWLDADDFDGLGEDGWLGSLAGQEPESADPLAGAASAGPDPEMVRIRPQTPLVLAARLLRCVGDGAIGVVNWSRPLLGWQLRQVKDKGPSIGS